MVNRNVEILRYKLRYRKQLITAQVTVASAQLPRGGLSELLSNKRTHELYGSSVFKNRNQDMNINVIFNHFSYI